MNPYGEEILENYVKRDKKRICLIKKIFGVEKKEISFGWLGKVHLLEKYPWM